MNARKLVPALVAALLLAFAAKALWKDIRDVNQLRAVLAGYAWWTFAAALGLATGNYVLRFLKWQYYLARLGVEGVPWIESFTVYLAGFALSITPAKAGEVFKSALLSSARGVPVTRTAPIVVADRLTDLISLILIAAVGSFWFEGGRWPALAGTVMVTGLLVFIMVPALGEWVLGIMERFPVARAIVPKARDAYAALRVLAGPSALLFPTLLSLVAWALECVALWIIARGLGHPISVAVAFFTYSVATVAGAVMMLPGGLGGTEATMGFLLRTLSRPTMAVPTAVTATLLVRFATLWFAVIVGVAALAVFRRLYDRNMVASVVPTDAEL